MAIDRARGVIAESFDVSVDDAAVILEQVAAVRGQTVLRVAENLWGRTRDGDGDGVSQVVDRAVGRVASPIET